MSTTDDLINNNGNIINISPCGGGGRGGTVTSVGLTSEDGSITIDGTSPIKKSGTYDISLPKIAENVGKFTNPTITIDEYGRVIKAESCGNNSVIILSSDITATPLKPNTMLIPMNNATRVVFTIPALVAAGTQFSVEGFGTAGWKITQQAEQSIYFGDYITTVGTTGGLSSTSPTDSIIIVCVVTNTTFKVISANGNNITIN